MLSGNEVEPKIKYLLKVFSRKKSESISIILESLIILFSELSKKISSSNEIAYVLIGEKSKKRIKTIENLISDMCIIQTIFA